MADSKPKKKRFEGLIQFREALRHTIVCLQASFEDRFAHALHSALLRELDQAPGECAHHLLFATGSHVVGQPTERQQLAPYHVLTRIHQQQTANLRSELQAYAGEPAHVSVWLDPSDASTSHYLFRLLSQVCNSTGPLDLKECIAWGGVLRSRKLTKTHKPSAFVEECKKEFSLSSERCEAMVSFVQAVQPLLKRCDKIHLIADGSTIGILLEGPPVLKGPAAMQQTLDQLANCAAHTIIVNGPGPDEARAQFAMFTPVRMNFKTQLLPAFALKGVILLENVRRTKKLKNSKLAG